MNEDDENLTPRQFFARADAEKRDYMREWTTRQGKPKKYINLAETYDAYGYVLDTGSKAKPALEYVAELHNKEDGWVDAVKSNPIHKDILRTTLEAHRTHPTAVLMKDKALAGPSHKRALRASQSVSAVLNALSDNVCTARHIQTLEIRVGTLENQVDSLEHAVIQLAQQANIDKDRLDNIERDVQHLTRKEIREYALQLHSEGVSISKIANKVGKSRQTISEWIKSI